MNWFVLAVICAFFTSTAATISKLLLRRHTETTIAWMLFLITLPFLIIVFLLNPVYNLGYAFWKTVAILLPIEMSALFLFLYALKRSPISLVFPFIGLTPVFTIFTAYVILGEKLLQHELLGVILVSLGAYFLNIHSFKEGPLAPIKNMLKERGILIMILVAFLYGLTATFGKKAALLATPRAFPAIYYTIFLAVLTPIAILRMKFTGEKVIIDKKDLFLFILYGIFFAVAILLHYQAITMAKVSSMIAVKRVSLIMGVIYGAIIFKERYIRYRLLGASVMLIGVLVLTLFR